MIRIHEIIEKISSYLNEADVALVQKAYVFSARAHLGQTRLSGEPYLSHPLEAANILADMRLDAATIAAGLLHDTVEDTQTTVDELEELFGEEVADIVDGVTKISLMTFDSKEEAQSENIRKLILAMAEDIRVVLVKLADRLHNMRTLDFQKHYKQALISRETLEIYAPLASRLGLYRIKTELEDLSLKYLKPDVYAQINEGIAKSHTAGEVYIERVIQFIESLLDENSIKGRVYGRRKHIFSIYHKMKQQGLTLDQVYDIIAFRVIVRSLKDCYAVLGLVHSLWKPVHGRFKDYISMPKNNMYQSLHTTVVGPEGERIEIQIRTDEMNQLAEFGVAAHWRYKEKGKGGFKAKDVERFTWLRQIMDWQRHTNDPREFMTTLRYDLFQDEVYVFTPQGEVKELPEGATPIDFAYLIHTEVGDHCAGAKINGRLQPLATALKNGDTVAIFTDNHRTPSRDWLKIVKTAKARTRIKHWIRTEERSRSIALGKEMLEKEGRKVGINLQKVHKDGSLDELAKDFSFPNADELFSAVGYVRITARKVLGRLQAKNEEAKPGTGQKVEPVKETKKKDTAKEPGSDSVRIKGVDDVLVHFAGCCHPLPGEPIVGYISRGRGVVVHTHDCPNVATFEPERLLQISWEGESDHPYPAKIELITKNKPGVLANIANLMAHESVNISSGTFRSTVEGKTNIEFTVEVKDSDHLYHVMEMMRKIEDVHEVTRHVVHGPVSQNRDS
ncbi:RelA/SpoT family protein [Desulfovibrio inopinatus]|uniref:RelA/SpoT family protein n=1 Tax=Desulfovibrio inopinatus TaxID=102109 RepID=UPI00040E0A21|nr:bifunctional (p)ppGpp synthetase/guanosine-3',5'-bis(diphosphate) 3'-pyrophosphohydrolase [Desulfovibrio inopinatus]